MRHSTEIIHVAAGAPYDVEITPGLLKDHEALSGRIGALLGERPAVIVTDTNVDPLYGHLVEEALCERLVGAIAVPAGEASKNPRMLTEVLERFAMLGLNRKGAVIALGGGVVGDLAGLAAALYMRGVPCLQMPTSLLAMVDSSVGGKTAVDLAAGKNMMGVFSQPVGVLLDPEALSTLPQKEVQSGWGEIIKYAGLDQNVARAVDAELLDGGAASGTPIPSAKLIAECVDLKRRIVESDEREAGERRLLNLGHTVGHAIETASDYRLSHGACVALGLRVLTGAMVTDGRLPRQALMRLDRLLTAAHLPRRIPEMLLADPKLHFSSTELLKIARHDKKSVADGVALVLPRAEGGCSIERISWPVLERWISAGLEA